MKLAMIGTGYVGLVSGTCFAEIGNKVICCDVDKSKIDMLNNGEIPIYEPGLKELIDKNINHNRLLFTTDIRKAIVESEIVYISVGTPMSDSGEADLRYIKEVAINIGKNMNSYKIVVIKSTVPVGTGKLISNIIQDNLSDKTIKFDIVSNPEFLREGSAISDCFNMERAIIGTKSDKAASIIKKLHEPFHTNILITDIESSEMIKYAANAFLATKISFINDIANICERVGADITKVAKGIGLDRRIGEMFLNAGIGYGGSCFPKDTYALNYLSNKVGYNFNLMKSVISTNENQSKIFTQKVIKTLGKMKGKTIAILGLAFKPNTNDMRYAPSLNIINELLEEGANIRAFDPVAITEAKKIFGNKISYSVDLYDAIENCDACIVVTDWEEIIKMDLDRVHSLLKEPIIFDGRNCFDLDNMANKGFEYYSIGRPSISTAAIAF